MSLIFNSKLELFLETIESFGFFSLDGIFSLETISSSRFSFLISFSFNLLISSTLAASKAFFLQSTSKESTHSN